jgi:hypothetical protein
MVDFQIIEIRDLLPITAIRAVPNLTPRTLSVYGRDFTSTYEVHINEEKSPSVVIVNSQNLLAQVPENQGNAAIRNVAVISSRLTKTARSVIEFRIGDTTKAVSGITRLVQTFLKILLQTPGTDIFAKNIGGGVLRAVSRQTGKDGRSMVSDAKIGVERTQRQLIALQANDPALTLQEKLLYAKLLEANFVPAELALVTKIRIANQANQDMSVGLGL